MNAEETVRHAIDQSIRQNEIVHVEVSGESIYDLIQATQDGNWDYSVENDGSLDCYSTAESRDSWRINVTGAGEDSI